MKKYAVLSAIGPDRVGLIEEISEYILEYNCNIEESRMAVLGGDFAMIILVEGEGDSFNSFTAEIPAKCSVLGLHGEVKITTPHKLDTTSRPYLVETISLDTQGIVHSVTELLQEFGINVDDLETDTTAAPWTGAPMFHMRIRISVPAKVSVSKIREKLDDIAFNQDLDIRFNPYGV
ncbi:MAG: glycine cleavage system protein R [Spirochaetia bacterium]